MMFMKTAAGCKTKGGDGRCVCPQDDRFLLQAERAVNEGLRLMIIEETGGVQHASVVGDDGGVICSFRERTVAVIREHAAACSLARSAQAWKGELSREEQRLLKALAGRMTCVCCRMSDA